MKKLKFLSLLIINILILTIFSLAQADLKPKKIQDYLYEIILPNYDWKDNETFTKILKKFPNQNKNSVACSAVRNGNFLGRNYDWIYDECEEFIVHIPATKNRYASLNVCNVNIPLANEKLNFLINHNSNSKYLKLLPFLVTDGINEKGVICLLNIVPKKDSIPLLGTNHQGKNLPEYLIPRYILDKANSVEEAIKLLKKLNIYISKFGSPFGTTNFCHYMIADPKQTIVIEFINNKLVILKNQKIMTNYYLGLKNYTLHAMGIERYNILKNNYSLGNTKQGMIDLINKVQYSKMYIPANKWYSENYGDNYPKSNIKDLNLNSNLIDKEKALKEEEYNFKVKERKNYKHLNSKIEDTWQTVHCSVYDIANKTLTIEVQENGKHYEFKL